MSTGTVGTTARQYHMSVVHFLRKTVAYNTTGIGSSDTVKVGILPAGASLHPVKVRVTAAFNAATTNVLTVGTSSGSDADIVNAADVNEGATGATFVTRGCDLTFAADTTIYVKYTQTGTAATAGAATIEIPYTINNDG